MSPLIRWVHALILIALLTAWSCQILPAPSVRIPRFDPFSPSLASTGRMQAYGSGSQIVDPKNQYPVAFRPVGERQTPAQLPALSEFIHQVGDGPNLAVRGVYIPGVLALPVVQQPPGMSAYVSEIQGNVTQFQLAAHYGVIGLLAHNYLSGSLFSQLEPGQDVYLVMGSGSLYHYQIRGIYEFQKITPSDPDSGYIDVMSGKELSMRQVFRRFYQDSQQLTFQTCLEKNGNLMWGLLFVQAEPAIAPIITFNRFAPLNH